MYHRIGKDGTKYWGQRGAGMLLSDVGFEFIDLDVSKLQVTKFGVVESLTCFSEPD